MFLFLNYVLLSGRIQGGGGGGETDAPFPLRDSTPMPTQRVPPLYYFELSIFG